MPLSRREDRRLLVDHKKRLSRFFVVAVGEIKREELTAREWRKLMAAVGKRNSTKEERQEQEQAAMRIEGGPGE